MAAARASVGRGSRLIRAFFSAEATGGFVCVRLPLSHHVEALLEALIRRVIAITSRKGGRGVAVPAIGLTQSQALRSFQLVNRLTGRLLHLSQSIASVRGARTGDSTSDLDVMMLAPGAQWQHLYAHPNKSDLLDYWSALEACVKALDRSRENSPSTDRSPSHNHSSDARDNPVFFGASMIEAALHIRDNPRAAKAFLKRGRARRQNLLSRPVRAFEAMLRHGIVRPHPQSECYYYNPSALYTASRHATRRKATGTVPAADTINISGISHPKSAVIRSGFLYKRSHRGRFQERYVEITRRPAPRVLQRSDGMNNGMVATLPMGPGEYELIYYHRRGGRAAGLVSLCGADAHVHETDPYAFRVVAPARQINFRAEDRTSRDAWVRTVRAAAAAPSAATKRPPVPLICKVNLYFQPLENKKAPRSVYVGADVYETAGALSAGVWTWYKSHKKTRNRSGDGKRQEHRSRSMPMPVPVPDGVIWAQSDRDGRWQALTGGHGSSNGLRLDRGEVIQFLHICPASSAATPEGGLDAVILSTHGVTRVRRGHAVINVRYSDMSSLSLARTGIDAFNGIRIGICAPRGEPELAFTVYVDTWDTSVAEFLLIEARRRCQRARATSGSLRNISAAEQFLVSAPRVDKTESLMHVVVGSDRKTPARSCDSRENSHSPLTTPNHDSVTASPPLLHLGDMDQTHYCVSLNDSDPLSLVSLAMLDEAMPRIFSDGKTTTIPSGHAMVDVKTPLRACAVVMSIGNSASVRASRVLAGHGGARERGWAGWRRVGACTIKNGILTVGGDATEATTTPAINSDGNAWPRSTRRRGRKINLDRVARVHVDASSRRLELVLRKGSTAQDGTGAAEGPQQLMWNDTNGFRAWASQIVMEHRIIWLRRELVGGQRIARTLCGIDSMSKMPLSFASSHNHAPPLAAVSSGGGEAGMAAGAAVRAAHRHEWVYRESGIPGLAGIPGGSLHRVAIRLRSARVGPERSRVRRVRARIHLASHPTLASREAEIPPNDDGFGDLDLASAFILHLSGTEHGFALQLEWRAKHPRDSPWIESGRAWIPFAGFEPGTPGSTVRLSLNRNGGGVGAGSGTDAVDMATRPDWPWITIEVARVQSMASLFEHPGPQSTGPRRTGRGGCRACGRVTATESFSPMCGWACSQCGALRDELHWDDAGGSVSVNDSYKIGALARLARKNKLKTVPFSASSLGNAVRYARALWHDSGAAVAHATALRIVRWEAPATTVLVYALCIAAIMSLGARGIVWACMLAMAASYVTHGILLGVGRWVHGPYVDRSRQVGVKDGVDEAKTSGFAPGDAMHTDVVTVLGVTAPVGSRARVEVGGGDAVIVDAQVKRIIKKKEKRGRISWGVDGGSVWAGRGLSAEIYVTYRTRPYLLLTHIFLKNVVATARRVMSIARWSDPRRSQAAMWFLVGVLWVALLVPPRITLCVWVSFEVFKAPMVWYYHQHMRPQLLLALRDPYALLPPLAVVGEKIIIERTNAACAEDLKRGDVVGQDKTSSLDSPPSYALFHVVAGSVPLCGVLRLILNFIGRCPLSLEEAHDLALDDGVWKNSTGRGLVQAGDEKQHNLRARSH